MRGMRRPPRVLHVLAQRPGKTGSGVTLEALVHHAREAGWEQHVVCAVPQSEIREGDESAVLGELPALLGGTERVHSLAFGGPELPFDVPGMSDVMPYASTRYSDLSEAQLEAYRGAWRATLARALELARPDVIHVHHVWIVSALLAELAGEVPCVVHVHATGLRQLELCPHLAQEVRAGVARHARFCVLYGGHALALSEALGVEPERIHVVGAGFDDEHFRSSEPAPPRNPRRVLFAGKLANAKGVGPLREAFERLHAEDPELELHVAGAGPSAEGQRLREELERSAGVTLLGQIPLAQLCVAMQQAAVFCLPSFYEGLPLVLVSAAAGGCRLVATALPGVVAELAPVLADRLELVAVPEMRTIDEPHARALPGFVDDLTSALRRALAADPPPAADLSSLTWPAVGARVEQVWRSVARSISG